MNSFFFRQSLLYILMTASFSHCIPLATGIRKYGGKLAELTVSV